MIVVVGGDLRGISEGVVLVHRTANKSEIYHSGPCSQNCEQVCNASELITETRAMLALAACTAASSTGQQMRKWSVACAHAPLLRARAEKTMI